MSSLVLAAAPAFAAAPSPSVPAPVAAPEGPAFDILEYQVEGNTVLEAADIETAIEPFLGPGRHMSDVESARAALEAVYQKAGYLTVGVDIPEQRIADGVVRLAVAEGRLRAVYVTGSRYHDREWIRTRVAALEPGRVPDFNALQSQLATLDRGEQRRVQPVLKPGRLPGTVDIDLQVSDATPWSGSVEANNQHSRGTTPWRLLGTVRNDDFGRRDESISLTAQVAPEKPAESRVLIANWSMPSGVEDTLAWNLVLSNSDVDTLGGTQVIGKGVVAGVRLQHPVGFAHGYWSFQAGVDYKDERQRQTVIDTPVRYLPFQLGAFGTWADGPDRATFNASATFAIGAIFHREILCPSDVGMTRQDQFSCAHYGSDGSFGLVKGDLRVSHRFDGGEQVQVRGGAQFASQPLLSFEQYALGGADTVRGYDEGEASGDEGALGSIQLDTRDLAAALFPRSFAERFRELAAFAFVDGGLAYNIQPAVGQNGHVSLMSAGAGVRLALRAGLEGQVDVAWPQKALPGHPDPGAHVDARVAWRF